MQIKQFTALSLRFVGGTTAVGIGGCAIIMDVNVGYSFLLGLTLWIIGVIMTPPSKEQITVRNFFSKLFFYAGIQTIVLGGGCTVFLAMPYRLGALQLLIPIVALGLLFLLLSFSISRKPPSG